MDENHPPFDYPPGNSLYHCLDHLLARPMFWLSFLFLVCLAVVLHRYIITDEGDLLHFPEARVTLFLVFALWPVFICEALLRFWLRGRQLDFWTRFNSLLLTIILPPTRMGGKSYLDVHLIWLPWMGWNHVDKHLRRRLEKAFSVPMIIIALLVLPVVALDFRWADAVRDNPGLKFARDVGSSLIWAAFALELIIMMSVARKKLLYCTRNWIDVAVVCLPLIDFLPIARLLRVLRLLSVQKLSQMSRLYRLRGLLMRAWRSILVLEVINRLLNSDPEKKLRQLRELEHVKEEELEELRLEISELEKQLAEEEQVEVEE